jgi:hypothetical protein
MNINLDVPDEYNSCNKALVKSSKPFQQLMFCALLLAIQPQLTWTCFLFVLLTVEGSFVASNCHRDSVCH